MWWSSASFISQSLAHVKCGFVCFLTGVRQHTQHWTLCERFHGWTCFSFWRGRYFWNLCRWLSVPQLCIIHWSFIFPTVSEQPWTRPGDRCLLWLWQKRSSVRLAGIFVCSEFVCTSDRCPAQSWNLWWRGPSATGPETVLQHSLGLPRLPQRSTEQPVNAPDTCSQLCSLSGDFFLSCCFFFSEEHSTPSSHYIWAARLSWHVDGDLRWR